MLIGKVLKNGGSQAIKLPKGCRFNDKEVQVNKIGEMVILTPINSKWNSFFDGLALFTDDFANKIQTDDMIESKREEL